MEVVVKRVFLSFKMEDKKQVDGIRLMAWNDRFDLEFYDESVRTPYDSEDAKYIRSQIKPKINRASCTVCFVGANTHQSKWVDWELQTSIDLGKGIVLMGLPRGPDRLTLPTPVRDRDWHLWNPDLLQVLIERVS